MSKILIVEDDRRIATALAIRLKVAGYEVVAAYNASLAVTTAVRQQPDLILLDISMPAVNGFTVAEKMQTAIATVGTPIIFIAAGKQSGLGEKAFDLEAAGFFEKPYQAAELLSTVRDTLGEPVGC